MNLFCVGLSHHTADVETRERYGAGAGSDDSLRIATGCEEALLLTTCNRVEFYGAASKQVSTEIVRRCLLRETKNWFDDDSSAFYRHEGMECVRHLFRVVCGLDSMVVGETEILGQTKKTYEQAKTFGVGPCLHRLFQRAFRVAKQVRTRTQITRGAVSVGSVAADLAQRIFGELDGRSVLILGAGETSERTARALVLRGVRDLRISNRTEERASSLATMVGGRAVPFESWESECREIDILITSTSAGVPLITRELVAPVLRERLDRPLFIIDLAVPRDVASSINDMEGVYLYDIDSLQSIAEQSLGLRRQQIAAANEIIAEHVADFCERFLEKTDSEMLRSMGSTGSVMTDRPLPASEF